MPPHSPTGEGGPPPNGGPPPQGGKSPNIRRIEDVLSPEKHSTPLKKLRVGPTSSSEEGGSATDVVKRNSVKTNNSLKENPSSYLPSQSASLLKTQFSSVVQKPGKIGVPNFPVIPEKESDPKSWRVVDSRQVAVTKKSIDKFKSICRNPNKPENQKKLAFAKSYLKQHGIPIPVNKSKSSSENPQVNPDDFEDPDFVNSELTKDQFEEIGIDEGEKV